MASRRTSRTPQENPQGKPDHIQHPLRISLRKEYLLAGAALCAITLLVYANSFRSGFVLDNAFLILQDPRVAAATSRNVRLILQHTYYWPQLESGLYRPITTLSYLVNYAVLGESNQPSGYHWFNLFLQALNALLVFALALRLVRKFRPSAFIAPAAFISLLWAVHPVLTESVTNIIGRSDLLAAASVLSGFWFYLKSTEATGWRRLGWLAGLGAVTAVGVFSKESAVSILGVIALYELTWWKDRRNVRGFITACEAMAPAFPGLVLPALGGAGSVARPCAAVYEQPPVRRRFFAGAAHRHRGDGPVPGAAGMARKAFLRLFLQRDSACQRRLARLDCLEYRGRRYRCRLPAVQTK